MQDAISVCKRNPMFPHVCGVFLWVEDNFHTETSDSRIAYFSSIPHRTRIVVDKLPLAFLARCWPDARPPCLLVYLLPLLL